MTLRRGRPGAAGLSSGRSPDRLDALVWAITALTERGRHEGPRIRVLGGRWCRYGGGDNL